MKIMRNVVAVGVLGACSLLFPNEARAGGSLDFSSSLSPRCLDTACLVVEFTLTVGGPIDGATEVDIFRLRRDLSSTTWAFGSVIDVRTAGDGFAANQLTPAEGGVGNWSSLIESSGSLQLAKGSGSQLPTPIRFTVLMAASPGGPPTGAQWTELTYTGQGIVTGGIQANEIVSFEGTVTPEPVTFTLLGTGLIGIGLVGLQRRRRQV